MTLSAMNTKHKIEQRSDRPVGLGAADPICAARFPDTIGTFMGRDALSLAASYLNLGPENSVLLPIYNCQDVLKSFARTNRVVFYDIREDLSIDPAEILAKLSENKIRIVVITNYFGFLQPHRNEIKRICRERGVVVIEDCAHSLLTEGSGDTGDMAIYSFRKILPIPDGGGLKINSKEKPLAVKFRPRLCSDTLSALISIKKFLNIHSNTFNRAGLTSRMGKVTPEKWQGHTTAPILPLSRFAEMAMAKLSFPNIIESRRNDFRYWQELCNGHKAMIPVFSELPEGVCPLGFPVMVENRGLIEHKARKAGILLRVHWRLDPGLATDCHVSHKLTISMLTLPVYPELGERERSILGDILPRP